MACNAGSRASIPGDGPVPEEWVILSCILLSLRYKNSDSLISTKFTLSARSGSSFDDGDKCLKRAEHHQTSPWR